MAISPRHRGAGPTLAILEALGPTMHAVLRIGTGLLFLQHGLQKLFGWLGDKPPVELVSLLGMAGILETIGGPLIALGLFTRPVAFLLAGQMAVAYGIAHLPRGPWPIQNGGELALLYMLIFGFLATNGAGPASIDHRRQEADSIATGQAIRRPRDRARTPL